MIGSGKMIQLSVNVTIDVIVKYTGHPKGIHKNIAIIEINISE